MNDGSLTMTYSAVVTGKDQKKMVRVTFERPSSVAAVVKTSGATGIALDRAEAILPDCKVTKQSGFTGEEISQLEHYLAQNKDDIISKAKVISNPLNWL